MHKYDHKQIEPKWQKVWEETKLYKTKQEPGKENYYTLVMFPYPSGDLHTGHWYNFGPADTFSRYQRMQGKNVLNPIGFDSFGLPAENAAIKRGIEPAAWTNQNIASMSKQLKMIGASYDWDKLIATSRPEYYKWTQWLFLQLYEAGLAYRAKGLQNWCPKDQTVLANEQVVGENNVCERCGTPVVKKEMEQWFFKITDYADRLLMDLDKVEWPDRVKSMQSNWIGRSEGALIKFAVDGSNEEIEVFTTRPDTLFGATYMVLAPEHPLVAQITTSDQKTHVEKYAADTARQTELDRMQDAKEKTGVFTGAYAVNPATNERIPVWVADYVLMSYGTGAIMAVPAHDERDFAFAKKFGLEVQQVVASAFTDTNNPPKQGYEDIHRQIVNAVIKHPTDDKYAMLRWSHNNYRTFIFGGIEGEETPEEAARREVLEETGFKNFKSIKSFGDTFISRFHAAHKNENRTAYVHGVYIELNDLEQDEVSQEELDKHAVEWVSFTDVLDGDTGVEPKQLLHMLGAGDTVQVGDGELINSKEFNGLTVKQAQHNIVKWLYESKKGDSKVQYKLRDWLISRQRYWGAPIPIIYCDACGIVPVPEDQLPVVLPTDVEFEPTGKSPLATRPDFYETTCPKCGKDARRETDTMDTFVDSSWYFLRYPNTEYHQGPFDSEAVEAWLPVDQYMGGIEHAILHLLYSRFITKVLYDQKLISFEEPFKKLFNQGMILGPDGQKMSKSRGNVVNPDEWVAKYGADTLRMYLMFMGPYDQGGPFDPNSISGANRFLHRVWTLVQEYVENKAGTEQNAELGTALLTATHKLIKRVSGDIQTFSFNTAEAAMMEYLNELYKFKVKLPYSDPSWTEALGIFVRLLAPFAPHITEEMWQYIGGQGSVHIQPWPEYREDMVREDSVDIAVQVNGKVRAVLTLPIAATEEEVKVAAQADAGVQKYLTGEIVKVIFVPRKLISFVVK